MLSPVYIRVHCDEIKIINSPCFYYWSAYPIFIFQLSYTDGSKSREILKKILNILRMFSNIFRTRWKWRVERDFIEINNRISSRKIWNDFQLRNFDLKKLDKVSNFFGHIAKSILFQSINEKDDIYNLDYDPRLDKSHSNSQFLTGMGFDEGRSHQASRPLPNPSCLRERHDAVNADLRR